MMDKIESFEQKNQELREIVEHGNGVSTRIHGSNLAVNTSIRGSQIKKSTDTGLKSIYLAKFAQGFKAR
jgi:hypothetical protein